jgi:hypothetical protein
MSPAGGTAAFSFFFGFSATQASVVISRLATLAASPRFLTTPKLAEILLQKKSNWHAKLK